jgi:hypothetical protein
MHLADTINIIPDFCVFKKSDTSRLETMVAFIEFAAYRIAIAVHPVHRAIDRWHEKGVCQKKNKNKCAQKNFSHIASWLLSHGGTQSASYFCQLLG